MWSIMTTALLIIDVQRGLCEGRWAMANAPAVIERINHMSHRVRARGQPVIFVQHEELGEGLVHDSEAWQLAPGLHVEDSDHRIRKSASDAFHNTTLRPLLQELGVTRLIVCGMQSDFCVDSTVRHAIAHGYDVTLLSDAHTTMANQSLSAEQIIAHHNETLGNIGGYSARVRCIPTAQAE